MFKDQPIDLFYNGGPIKYSLVLILIILSSLAAMRKIQKNMLTKMRPVGPININTIIEYQIGRHLRKWSITTSGWQFDFTGQFGSTGQKSFAGILEKRAPAST